MYLVFTIGQNTQHLHGFSNLTHYTWSPGSPLSSFLTQCFLSIAATATKSLQSCPTLWEAIDSSPPGSAVPGILQARVLEWIAISFSNAWKWEVKVKWLSRVRLLATPWTADYQAPPSMGFFQARVLEWVAISFSTVHHDGCLNYSIQLLLKQPCCYLVAELCPTLSNPMDSSPPGFSVHGISQVRILEWIAISSSRESFWTGTKPISPASFALAGEFFILEPPG